MRVRERAPRGQRLSGGALRRALGFARGQRRFIGLSLLMTLLVALANALEPLVLKGIFDALGGVDPWRTLAGGLISLAALGVAREATQAASNWLSWRARLRVHQALLDATVERIHRLPHDVQREQGVGAIMTRLDRSIQGFVGAVSDISFNVLPAIAYLVLALVFMLRLDARLTVAALAFAPLPALVAAWAAPRQTARERFLLDRWSRIYGRFNEVLSGIVTVRSFAMEDHEKRRFMRDVGQVNSVVIRGVRYDGIVVGLQNLAGLFARVAALGLGGWLVARGEITIGTLVAFLGYLGGLFGPVQGLASVYRTLRLASVSVGEIFRILDTHDRIGDAPGAIDVPAVAGRVTFRDVHFTYAATGNRVLEGIDLEVPAGSTLALVGPSGSGKTTLVALLQRFYDPLEGTVELDGLDLRRYKQACLRRHLGVVLQDALLFNDSVYANIAYGRPHASEQDVIAAARAANAHDFIMALEKGYDTRAGERGSRFSGGERQRIAIARALLKDPRILILDEATSALDAETEALVQDALERLLRGRTAIVIAHRLATVVRADAIAVMRKGRIVERGTHRELLRRGGYYADLVARQTRGLLVPPADDHDAAALARMRQREQAARWRLGVSGRSYLSPPSTHHQRRRRHH